MNGCGGGGQAYSDGAATTTTSTTGSGSSGATSGTGNAIAGTSLTTSWGVVNQPSLPTLVCASLTATLTPINGSIDNVDESPSNSQPDTLRIQNAINTCPAGQAIRLSKGAAGQAGFLSAPLKLNSGVTLWIDQGVTLFASRNPADYDNGPGTCGTAIPTDLRSCNPFILADSTNGSGIVGDGAIDGRGGSLLTSGPNAKYRSWWDVAYQNKSDTLSQQNPMIIRVNNSSNFTLYRVAVMNSPNFHISTSNVAGVTAWGIKILSPSAVYTKPRYACPTNSTPDKITPATCFTPDTVKNTDGFDPGQSSKVLLAYSYISVGDDNVAVKSHTTSPSTNLAFLHNHFYYGHGMSIGSETDSGLNNMLVSDLTIDGNDSSVSIGLRIKSDSSRGGLVTDVTYSQICMRNVRQPLVFDSFYRDVNAGTKYPAFTNITIRDFHNLGSAKYASGTMTFAGYNANAQKNPIGITLDNVVFDGKQPGFDAGHNGGPSVLPAATHFTFGPGQVSFASSIISSIANDVTVSGSSGSSTPLDCGAAFVPFNSVLADSPI
ncbi:glycoside hydrolase family 28 protein [Undibacterium sp. Di26W]|uniref:glycoside hydrolase family 28 protein n=1 Tax=Undibacterium sp. Di26W TaxID=3413035 RepID=UPI003BF3CE4A